MNVTRKVQLRNERLALEGLICRYGNITLWDAHDRVSAELDYFRGAGSRRKLKNDINEQEYLGWMV